MAYGYLLVEMKATDMDQYKQYMLAAQEAVKAAGGEYLVRGGRHEVLEGGWKPVRLALLRFPSYEQAKAFYDGQQYTCPMCSLWNCRVFDADDTSFCVNPNTPACTGDGCAPGYYCTHGFCFTQCS